MAGQCPGPQHDHRGDRVQRDHPRDGDLGHADGAAGPLILALDRACLAIFVVEIALKLVALGGRFFRSGWNLFDFVIVGIALVPGRRACRCCARCASCGFCASSRWRRRCAAWWRGSSPRCPAWAGVPADGDHLLHRRGDGDEAVRRSFPDWFGTLGHRSIRCSRS
jgi:hypothetical protein